MVFLIIFGMFEIPLSIFPCCYNESIHTHNYIEHPQKCQGFHESFLMVYLDIQSEFTLGEITPLCTSPQRL